MSQGVQIIAAPSSEIVEGEQLTIICQISGSFPVQTTITWKYNDSHIVGSNQQRSIHFPSIKRLQAGLYSCEIDFTMDKVKRSVTVNVICMYLQFNNCFCTNTFNYSKQLSMRN